MSHTTCTCIGCGCDDHNACWDDLAAAPCHWLRLHSAIRLGLCSACPEMAEAWDCGDRELRVPIERGE